MIGRDEYLIRESAKQEADRFIVGKRAAAGLVRERDFPFTAIGGRTAWAARVRDGTA